MYHTPTNDDNTAKSNITEAKKGSCIIDTNIFEDITTGQRKGDITQNRSVDEDQLSSGIEYTSDEEAYANDLPPLGQNFNIDYSTTEDETEEELDEEDKIFDGVKEDYREVDTDKENSAEEDTYNA